MTEQKKMISGSILGKLKAAEDSLARQETKALDDFLPKGHPLKEEVEKQKALLGGDLKDLPPGHPLLRMLEAAKRSYEITQAESEAKKMKDEAVKVRKAKRVEEASVKKEKLAQEDAEAEQRRVTAKVINSGIAEVLTAIKSMWGNLASSEEVMNKDPMGRARLLRLKRILYATERGLSEIRFSRI